MINIAQYVSTRKHFKQCSSDLQCPDGELDGLPERLASPDVVAVVDDAAVGRRLVVGLAPVGQVGQAAAGVAQRLVRLRGRVRQVRGRRRGGHHGAGENNRKSFGFNASLG